MPQTKLVVFDMAGTTIVDKGNVSSAFIQAFLAHELDIPAHEVHKVMGYRKVDAIKLLLERFYPDMIDQYEDLIPAIHHTFEQSMVDFYLADTSLAPLPGAEEIFKQLKDSGIKTALNTGFTRKITDAILQRLNWKDSSPVDAVICSDEVPEGRPEPYMIQELMRQCGVTDPGQVVKIGDTEVDILEGRNAHCGLVVSVTTGAYSRNELLSLKPDHIIDSLENLIPLIQKN
jgi:phosphonatase-like hydrolase